MHSLCGKKGHYGASCRTIVGYPKTHLRYKPPHTQNNFTNKPRPSYQNQKPRWNPTNTSKMVVTTLSSNTQPNTGLLFTPQQLEQLAKLFPHAVAAPNKSETDDEIDGHFLRMIASCYQAYQSNHEWIIDFGASDHMTSHIQSFTYPVPTLNCHKVNLPTRYTSMITHTGQVKLTDGLTLVNVLCVPHFKQNLLSVQKLINDGHCEVKFLPTYYVIIDRDSNTVIGTGRSTNGLYYLNNKSQS